MTIEEKNTHKGLLEVVTWITQGSLITPSDGYTTHCVIRVYGNKYKVQSFCKSNNPDISNIILETIKVFLHEFDNDLDTHLITDYNPEKHLDYKDKFLEII